MLMLILTSPAPYCRMWFRIQKQFLDFDCIIQGVANLDGSPFQGSTVVPTIPVEPGDFQRVRLLYQELNKKPYWVGKEIGERTLRRVKQILWILKIQQKEVHGLLDWGTTILAIEKDRSFIAGGDF